MSTRLHDLHDISLLYKTIYLSGARGLGLAYTPRPVIVTQELRQQLRQTPASRVNFRDLVIDGNNSEHI